MREYRAKHNLEDRIKVLRKEAAKTIEQIFTLFKEIDDLQNGWVEHD